MIGVKGVGMTMVGQFFALSGIEVIGSDTEEKFMTDKILKQSGITVIENFKKENIPTDTDLIIYSTAYNQENNIEVEFSLKSNIKTLTYAQALGVIFNSHHGIAVTGSHGKTTTTAWLGYLLQQTNQKPTVMVGSFVRQLNGFTALGNSRHCIIEADEYQNKLQYYDPKIVLLNNIDYDHPDFFPDEESYLKTFLNFIKKIPPKGFLIANFDDPNIRKIACVNCLGKIITYTILEKNNTFQPANYIAYDLKQKNNKQYFKVGTNFESKNANNLEEIKKNNLGEFCIQLSGKHNISNALAVISTCIELEVSLFDIRKYLEKFTGTARRMEVLGNFKKALLIDDYAHHPTEIKTTLAGARKLYENKKIIVVFHPHTFTRTRALLDDFGNSFEDADQVIVLDIYGSAREKQGGVHSRDLVKKINNKNKDNKKAYYIPTLKKCENYLRENIDRDQVIILMGAGDVFRIGEKLLNSINN